MNWTKNEIAFNFIWYIPFKMNRTKKKFTIKNPFKIYSEQKKLSFKLGLKNTLYDREVRTQFFIKLSLEGDFENHWGNSPTCQNF